MFDFLELTSAVGNLLEGVADCCDVFLGCVFFFILPPPRVAQPNRFLLVFTFETGVKDQHLCFNNPIIEISPGEKVVDR